MHQEPALFLTRIRHTRREPVHHQFEYHSYSWFFDVDHPPRLPWLLRPLVSFKARDHLAGPGIDLRSRVEALLAREGIPDEPTTITALMNARVLGYVFDPLSLFWCRRADGQLICAIAEVHNTYGERHAYILIPDGLGRAGVVKTFFVSPFNDVTGRYLLRIPEPGEILSLQVALLREHRAPFTASMSGKRVTVTPSAVLRAQFHAPFAPWLIAARIRKHGIALCVRGLRTHPRPSANRTPRTPQ